MARSDEVSGVETGAGVETLARARLPLAWIALAASVIVPFVTHQLPGRPTSGGVDGLLAAAADWAAPTPALLVLVLILTCVLWRPLGAAARPLVLTAAVLVTLSVLASIAVAIWLTSQEGTIRLWGVGYLVPTLLVAITLWVVQAGLTEPASIASQPSPREIEADVPLHQRPTWSPDQASGAAWQSASGAAQGGQASGWGAPGRPRGRWDPAPEVEGASQEHAERERQALEEASRPESRPESAAGGGYSAKSWTAGGPSQPPDQSADEPAAGDKRSAPDWGV